MPTKSQADDLVRRLHAMADDVGRYLRDPELSELLPSITVDLKSKRDDDRTVRLTVGVAYVDDES